MCCTSVAMWPNCASDLQPLRRVLMRMRESPSNIIRSEPCSATNSTTLLPASASDSTTVNGKGNFWERDAITKPCSFLITALIPAQFSLAKRAPSKLILYYEAFGGCQEVAGKIHCGVGFACNAENSWNQSLACWRSCFSVTVCWSRHILFLRFHTAQMTIEKRVGSWFSTNMQPSKSIKLSHCFSLLWFHRGTSCHNSASFGQRYRA